MACKYIFNGVEYKDKQTFIEEFVKPNFINQPKTLRLQELQQPDFLKFIRKDKDYLKSQGLTDQEVDFLNLLFGDNEKWVGFFIKSVVQNAAKEGYSKIWLPSGNTSAKVEGHTTLEEFKKQKEDRIKDLEKQKATDFYQETEGKNAGMWLGKDKPYKDKRFAESSFDNEINQLKQELERVEGPEGFGALKPIYNFYENTVTNILNKTYGKENVKLITDEYGNTWNEVTITPKMSETIRLNTPNGKIEYTGDLAIEEKIAEEAFNSKDEKVPKTLIGKFIQSIRNLLRDLYKETDRISRLIRNLNQGRFNLQNNQSSDGIRYSLNQSLGSVKEGVEELFNENLELADAVYEALGFVTPLKALESNFEKVKERLDDFNDFFAENLGISGLPFDYFKEVELNIDDLDLSVKNKEMFDVLYQKNKASDYLKSELTSTDKQKKPILINNKGQVVEGWHRIHSLKANNIKTIKAYVPITPQQKQQGLQQYSQYLDQIFPGSETKDILYHNSPNKFEKFDNLKIGSTTSGIGSEDRYLGIFFTSDKNAYEGFNIKGFQYPSILNLKNPINGGINYNNLPDLKTEEDFKNYQKQLIKDNYDGIKYGKAFMDMEEGGYQNPILEAIVFKPEQIHVLGGKNDIQGFKKFVNQSSNLNLFENERLNAAKEINKELLQSSKGRSANRLQSAKISPMETELNKKFFSTDTFYKKRALSETEKTTEDGVFEVGSNNSLLYAIRQKLSDPNSVNGRLFAKLNSLAKIKVIITDSKDDIYVVDNDLYINPEGFSKSLAESDGENYLEALLFEELIHIASNKIVPKSKEQSIINAQIKADPDFVSKVNQSYVTDNKRQAYFEYIRLKVQDAVTSTTTLKERMTWSDQLLGVYKELLDIIYSVIETKTTKKLIKEHIEFVEDAIKEQRASSIKPASSELKDYFKRVQQTPEVGNLLSVIDDVLPQYPAYDINSLVGLLIEAPEFTQDLKNTPGTGFPYVNLHKEVSTALLKAKGIIPNTEAYYKAMEMFGYENKPLTFAEDKTSPISSSEINSLKNDIISTSNRVLSDKKLIEPSSDSLQTDDKRGNAIEQGGNVLISDSLLKRFNGKTFTEIFNSNEFTEDEKKSALFRSLQERLITGDTFNTRLYRKLRRKLFQLRLQAVEKTEIEFDLSDVSQENKKIIQSYIDFIGEQPDIIPNLEKDGQLPEYSKMVELLQELTTGEIPNNTPVLRPDFRLYFNPPLLSKRAKIPVQDTERYVAIFDSIQERLGKRTLTELRDSREFNRMEWGGILLYALEQALRLEMPINSETIQKVKDFLVGNNRLNDSTFAESDSQFFSREDFQNRLSDEFVSADAPIFQLNLPKPPDSRYKSDAANNVLYTGKKVTVLNALQERAGNRNINELWVSGEFNDLEWEQLLILYLRKKLLDTNTFHGRLYKKLKSELGDDFRVDVSNSNKFTFFVEGTEIKINTKEVIKELKKNKITNINRSLELTLAEEMIHVVSNVLRTPQEYKNLFVSQFLNNNELTNNLSEVYRSFKKRMGTYQAPMEFFRMGVQDHFFKQVTEMSSYSLQDFYQSLLKGLKYLRDVFVEPTNKKLIDEHIAYIEDALRNIDVVSYETLMQYNTTPEIWEVAESVEQFDRFKKDYPFPENTEELIKDFKEFANLVPANINLDCK